MNEKKKVSLFGDDEQDEQGNDDLGFNKGYAQNYDNWRRLEEMQKIKDKYGDDDDGSSSESEPEWTDEHEEAFLRTLGALKSGDSSCFANGKSFFNEIHESTGGKTKKMKKKTAKKDEKMTIKDYERKLVLEKGGQIDESDEEAEIQKTHRKGYYEEQEEIRKSLSAAINFGDDDDEEEDILKERKKTSKEQEDEDDDFYEWMKTADGKADKKKAKELKHLKKFWKDDDAKLDDSEKFLRDYLLNKDYQPGENEDWTEEIRQHTLHRLTSPLQFSINHLPMLRLAIPKDQEGKIIALPPTPHQASRLSQSKSRQKPPRHPKDRRRLQKEIARYTSVQVPKHIQLQSLHALVITIIKPAIETK